MKVDVVIVGGRCAGSVLALRLARAGARVAIVDRDELGTDTLSTHAIWPNTLARLDELGVLDAAAGAARRAAACATGCASSVASGGRASRRSSGFDRGMAPRRVALDRVLAEAALEAGAVDRYGEKVADAGRGATATGFAA